MTTIVIRIPLDDALPLDERIRNECDMRMAAGMFLGGCFIFGDQLVMIFQ